ncbi:MAG: cytochrome c3 family protein [Deltaproteobacteria bacterium]|nr:cytochrome c3 family protein [Candidatus Tharpella aukensis]
MKKLIALVVVAAFLSVGVVAFAAPTAPAGELIVTPMMKSDKKAPVKFSHEKHAVGVPDCKTCHHTWDGKSAMEKCSKCHTGRKSGDKPNIKNAMHNSCKKCHKDRKAAGKPAGPTSCKKCHKK